ncbi:response regulator transcription factor [Streptomyces sp. SID2888]|uniref:LuxR C-terminal-related transcriptional regulator n=1 Tax=Streptomyces sp. SID2888 TaxID=2690256 RepID=UPI0013698E0D|nr:response regulator transcription factor [Streptomyces sp. SID2888]MYV49599.1 response regulator [Streptomyces sp. SID2888]
MSETLLLGERHPLARRRLRALFEGDPAFRVRGETGNGHTLLELARTHRPDLVLVDADLPGPDILDLVHRLAEDRPGSSGVVLLVSDGGPADSWVLGAARAGVRGFLFKREGPQEILSGVRKVARGGFAVSPEIVSQILRALHGAPWSTPSQRCADMSMLTPRETQVFRLVAQGLTNQQISHVLVLSEGTVKSYFNRVCRKLALRNRVDAVILAYEMGIAGAVPT